MKIKLGTMIRELVELSKANYPVTMDEGTWKRNVVPLIKRRKELEKALNHYPKEEN